MTNTLAIAIATFASRAGAKLKATVDRLSKLSGNAFDKACMKEMLTDHTQGPRSL